MSNVKVETDKDFNFKPFNINITIEVKSVQQMSDMYSDVKAVLDEWGFENNDIEDLMKGIRNILKNE
jgi:hypothetical protein